MAREVDRAGARGRRQRIGATVVPFAVCLVLVCCSTGAGPGGERDDGATTTSEDHTRQLDRMDFAVGDCVTYDNDSDRTVRTETLVVPCSRTHLFEVAGVVDLSDIRTYPSGQEWAALYRQRCLPIYEAYLGHPVVNHHQSPYGRYRIRTGKGGWDSRPRQMVCTIGRRQVDLAAWDASKKRPMTGRIADLPIVPPYEAGDCIRWGARVGRVPCTDPHEFEVTGLVHAPSLSGAEHDIVGWRRLVKPRCAQLLVDYLGDVPNDVQAPSLELSPELWAMGQRDIVCLAAQVSPAVKDWVDRTAPLRRS